MNVDSILEQLCETLVDSEVVQLVPRATPAQLARELRAILGGARAFSQLGPALGAALIASDLVDEVYATDEELVNTLTELGRSA